MVAISRQLATTIEKVRLYEETCRAYEDLRKTQEQLLQSRGSPKHGDAPSSMG